MAEDPSAPATTAQVDEELWKELKTKVYVAQTAYFLNVYWTELSDDDKECIKQLLLKFDEQQKKFSAKPHSLAYPNFCKVLQQLEESQKRISDCLKEAGDRVTMGKRFQALGFKLSGEVTCIEALLFLFNKTTLELTTSPPTPMDAALRERKKELAAIEKSMQDKIDAKAKCEADIKAAQDGHSPMQAMKLQQELVKCQKAIDDAKIQHDRDVKKGKKAIEQAEAALAKEKSEGTTATAWLREVCSGGHIPFSTY
jgi:chromosome segregation ATPase